MSTITATESGTTAPRKAHTFGLIGIVVAFLGLAGAIFSPLALEVQRPPPKQLSDVLADTAVKIKDRFTKREALPPPPRETDWRVVAIITASSLGFIGAALGTASWIRREDLRISGAAVAVGVTAIAFHYILAAIGITIGLVIVAWILSHFS
ncbi:MAG: hypothetical protein JWQ71_3624 [Pedosphaera sp.]|nr:hypothetical protein [Pedosphaera sp.]